MADDQALNPSQEQALIALLSESTIAAAAKKAGVGERTLYTWLKEPAFADAYREARREAVRQAVARLQRGSSDAVDALTSIVRNKRMRASTRVAAASKILELAIKAVELEDIEARLAVLEQHMERKR